MIIELYENGECVKKGYANKDISKPIKDLEKGLQYYFIEEIKPINTDSIRYYLKPNKVVLTEEKHPEYSHFLKAVKEWELVEFSQDLIIEKLNHSVGDWIESNFPIWKQTKYLSRFIYLDMLKRDESITEDQLTEMAYLNDLDNWVIKCRADRDLRESDFINNGVFPSFEWDLMPTKTF